MKTGRPKLPEGSRKQQITGVRLRTDERTLVEKAAAGRNQKLSAWIRTTLVSTAHEQIEAQP